MAKLSFDIDQVIQGKRRLRSEERRVGKWCDWSSDVCSSDLAMISGVFRGIARDDPSPPFARQKSFCFKTAEMLELLRRGCVPRPRFSLQLRQKWPSSRSTSIRSSKASAGSDRKSVV